MSLTALAFASLFGAGLMLAFYRPIFGLGTYVWTFYSNPSGAWWGVDLPDLRWSLVAALVTLVASMIADMSAPSVSRIPTDAPGGARPGAGDARPFWLLSAFVGWMWIQALWAVDADRHLIGCILFTKLLVLYVLIRRIVRDAQTLEIFAWIHVLGAFTWGWIAFRTDVQGRFEPILGPAMDDANALGFQLVTATAFAGFMFIGLRGAKRWLVFATLPFLLNVIILTASRSALLGLAAAGVAALWQTPKEKRRVAYGCAALGVVLLIRLAGSELFWERTATLAVKDIEALDASAASRFDIASANWRMFVDHPLGAGYMGNAALSPGYLPESLLGDTGVRSAHNTFLAVLVDVGAPGFILFVLLLVNALATLFRLKRLDKTGLPTELGIYRAATGAGLAAFCVSGQFLNLLPAEVWVWLVALLAALNLMAHTLPRRPPEAQSAPSPPNLVFTPLPAAYASNRPRIGR